MGLSLHVDIESVPVKKPKFFRFFIKELRIRCLLECHLGFLKVRVCVPETLPASKSGQTRVSRHTCACCQQNCL